MRADHMLTGSEIHPHKLRWMKHLRRNRCGLDSCRR
jgi:hypothetical protein